MGVKIFNEEFKDTLIKIFLDKNPRKLPKNLQMKELEYIVKIF